MGTPKGEVFVQEQLNLSTAGESNLTAEFGVVGGLELGVNLNHVNLYKQPSRRTARNAFMANAVYTRAILDWLQVQFGAAAGAGMHPLSQRAQFVSQGWAVTRLTYHRWDFSFIAGAYAGTTNMMGGRAPVGPMIGIEWGVIPRRLYMVADLLMGVNEAAVAVVGGAVWLTHNLVMSAGAQLPAPGSGNGFGGVFELTWQPPDEPTP